LFLVFSLSPVVLKTNDKIKPETTGDKDKLKTTGDKDKTRNNW
jgi:hypothetical protein